MVEGEVRVITAGLKINTAKIPLAQTQVRLLAQPRVRIRFTHALASDSAM